MALSKQGIMAYRLLLLLALVVNTYLTTIELSPTLEQVNDKLGHVLAYFSLALLADFAFPSIGFNWRKWLPLMLYGLLIEIIQHQIPYRQFSVLDLVANGGGLVLYRVLSLYIRRCLPTRM
jgi:VanZ family protein